MTSEAFKQYFDSNTQYSSTYADSFSAVPTSASRFGVGNEAILSELDTCCSEILSHVDEPSFWGENGKHLSSIAPNSSGVCSKFTNSIETHFRDMLRTRACDICCGEQVRGSTFLWCIKPHIQSGLDLLPDKSRVRCGWFYRDGVQEQKELDCIMVVNDTYWHIYPDHMTFRPERWMARQWHQLNNQ